jgi:hypothetical protein
MVGACVVVLVLSALSTTQRALQTARRVSAA